jgi:DNA-directed RNA polymerase subunit L
MEGPSLKVYSKTENLRHVQRNQKVIKLNAQEYKKLLSEEANTLSNTLKEQLSKVSPGSRRAIQESLDSVEKMHLQMQVVLDALSEETSVVTSLVESIEEKNKQYSELKQQYTRKLSEDQQRNSSGDDFITVVLHPSVFPQEKAPKEKLISHKTRRFRGKPSVAPIVTDPHTLEALSKERELDRLFEELIFEQHNTSPMQKIPRTLTLGRSMSRTTHHHSVFPRRNDSRVGTKSLFATTNTLPRDFRVSTENTIESDSRFPVVFRSLSRNRRPGHSDNMIPFGV